MKIQSHTNNSSESSEIAQELIKSNDFLPITITGMLWVITIILGVFTTLMILFVSLTFWVVTKNPIFVISALFGGILFVIWGYLNLHDKDRIKKPEN